MDKNVLEVIEPKTEEERFFHVIQDKYRISEDRFKQGVEFAQLIAEGSMPASKAYVEVFGVEQEVANKKSSKLKHSRWVQELIRYFQFDDELEYTNETRIVIQRLMGIITDTRSSAREITEATKALQPYIKQQTQKIQATIDVNDSVDPTEAVMTKMALAMKTLAAEKLMIGQNGEVIDVTIIE